MRIAKRHKFETFAQNRLMMLTIGRFLGQSVWMSKSYFKRLNLLIPTDKIQQNAIRKPFYKGRQRIGPQVMWILFLLCMALASWDPLSWLALCNTTKLAGDVFFYNLDLILRMVMTVCTSLGMAICTSRSTTSYAELLKSGKRHWIHYSLWGSKFQIHFAHPAKRSRLSRSSS